MTKKEKIEYALDQWATGTMGLLPALRAIIDALPDEPETAGEWIRRNLEGPEPVAEKASEPSSDWHRVYQMAKELMQLSEVRPASELDVNSGQRSEGTASAGGATQHPPLGPWLCIDEPDIRRLRIMKAMEEMGAFFNSDIRTFKFTPSGWYWTDPRQVMDWQPMEQYLKTRAPEEPLWEGELWVNPCKGITKYGGGGHDFEWEAHGWRKIKVRETRE